MSQHLQIEIDRLKKLILSLAAQVEEEVTKATRALIESNKDLANEVVEQDSKIDQMEVDTEEECLKVLALHQPVAVDLRYIISVLKINSDLSRIGDLAVSIARNAQTVLRTTGHMTPDIIPAMSDRVKDILRKSLDALIEFDNAKAREVLKDDDAIDDLHTQMKKRIKAQLRETPEQTDVLLALLQISRRLERIADHAVHVSEDVIYMIEAEVIRHKEDTE